MMTLTESRRSLDPHHPMGRAVVLNLNGQIQPAWIVGHTPESIILEATQVFDAETPIELSSESRVGDGPVRATVGDVICVATFYVYMRLNIDAADRLTRARWVRLITSDYSGRR
jgi:hypothetical protein